MRLTVDKMYKEQKSYPLEGAFALLSESDRQLLDAMRQRSIDIYGPALGRPEVSTRFDRYFDEETIKVWADLSIEEKASQLKQFDETLQQEVREVSEEALVKEAVNDDEGEQEELEAATVDEVKVKAKNLGEQAERPSDKKLGEQAERPSDKKSRKRSRHDVDDFEDDEDYEEELAFFDDLGPLDEEPIEDGPSVEGFLIKGHRPRTRSECPPYRPCPYVTCRYHLYLDVTRRGRMRYNFPDIEVTNLDMSCALDLAERGPRTLEEIGSIMGGISRERVRQIEQAALNLLRMRGGRALAEFLEDREAPPPPTRPAKKAAAGQPRAKKADDADEG
ncbi:MAG: sigma factor-like helix-turn-helix DNA-binding protein [Myxococcota bacterium]|jgi:hypothetical protein|nr:sigma factor-like helix-turn-helix DNA-binding protein [Myxococcota bacterium]